MFSAYAFGKRILCLLLGCAAVLLMAMPVSAAMREFGPEMKDRTVAAVHYSAGYHSTVIGNLENGTELTVTGGKDDFLEIECGGMTGYIAKEQTKVDDNGCYYVNCQEESGETDILPCIAETEVEALQGTVEEQALDLLGVPYVWGGTSPDGFDCSGFVQYVYGQIGYTLNRTATNQLCNGLVVTPEDMQPGDLVFFRNTMGDNSITSHVGIYTGDGRFVHASSRGISESSLDEPYYAERFLCARRVILSGVISYQSIPEVNTNISKSSGRQTGVF